jgi:hypothetical protein
MRMSKNVLKKVLHPLVRKVLLSHRLFADGWRGEAIMIHAEREEIEARKRKEARRRRGG